MKKYISLFIISTVLLFFVSCNSTRHLGSNQYMLTKNVVKVTDLRDDRLDDLYYLVRPVPNKKFIDVFPFKTWLYSTFQPTVDTLTGEVIKDTKFKKWARGYGEAPVLLDSAQVSYSVEQLKIELRNKGYFNAEVTPEVHYRKKNKLASVTYYVQANSPYYIQNIKYDIDILRYRRLILQDTNNSEVKSGNIYDATQLLREKDRIINSIRDKGYYHVPNNIVYFIIDTIQKENANNAKKLVDIEIKVDLSRITDTTIFEKMMYRYKFNNIYIYTNYDPSLNYAAEPMDTITFIRSKKDPTRYFFITPQSVRKTKKNGDYKFFRDYRYRTLSDVMYTKKEVSYARSNISRSYKRLNDLRNFRTINIECEEVKSKLDTVAKTGYLNSIYRLSRNKIHSFAAEADVRSDKTNIMLSYSNKNIFKGAEYFNINGYFGMDILFKKTNKFIIYSNNAEAGGEISLDFPRLFIFRKTQNIESLRYNTQIRVGTHWQRAASLYQRLILNSAFVYNWTPTYQINHSLAPIDISIVKIDKYKGFDELISRYSTAFRKKYEENVLVTFKYIFNYNVALPDKRNSFSLRIRLESSGLTVCAVNALLSKSTKPLNSWKFFGLNYATYEMTDIDLRYYHKVNKKNSLAARFNFGIGIPLFNSTVMPFEKSFYLGGANSMRAWQFRTLGPGSYYSSERNERSGDVKLEMNLEYRGTIYKFIKYGVFADVGNIWLIKRDVNMKNAEFQFNRFYKELACAAGAGLRLDFNFFIIRLDIAFPIHDPNDPEGERWVNKLDLKKLYIPLAIGYAF